VGPRVDRDRVAVEFAGERLVRDRIIIKKDM